MFRRTSILAALSLASTLAVTPLASAEYSGPPRILIIPFSTLNVPDNQQWIGRAVQENLIANLGRGNVYSPIAYQGQLIVEDNNTAATLAHKSNAVFVVRGSAQMIDQSLRFTAQMIDAGSGDTITTASVTGNSSDVLKLEDDLSNQLESNATAIANAQAQAQAAAATQPTPQVAVSPPISSYTPGYSYPPAPTYTAPYYYDPGYYSAPYYYYYNPFYFGVSYFNYGYYHNGHDHDHDGGGNHGGWGGGGHPGGPPVVHPVGPGGGMGGGIGSGTGGGMRGHGRRYGKVAATTKPPHFLPTRPHPEIAPCNSRMVLFYPSLFAPTGRRSTVPSV